MDPAVVSLIVGVVAAVFSGGSAILVGALQHNKTMALINNEIKHLTAQVEKHNSVIERTYLLEKENGIQNEKIKELERQVEEIKHS